MSYSRGERERERVKRAAEDGQTDGQTKASENNVLNMRMMIMRGT